MKSKFLYSCFGVGIVCGSIFLLAVTYMIIDVCVQSRAQRILTSQEAKNLEALEQDMTDRYNRVLRKIQARLDFQVFSGMENLVSRLTEKEKFVLPPFQKDKVKLDPCDYVAFTFHESEIVFNEDGRIKEESRQAMEKEFFLGFSTMEGNDGQARPVAIVFVTEGEDRLVLIGDIQKIFPQQRVIVFRAPAQDGSL